MYMSLPPYLFPSGLTHPSHDPSGTAAVVVSGEW
jgi:hypothetical protein